VAAGLGGVLTMLPTAHASPSFLPNRDYGSLAITKLESGAEVVPGGEEFTFVPPGDWEGLTIQTSDCLCFDIVNPRNAYDVWELSSYGEFENLSDSVIRRQTIREVSIELPEQTMESARRSQRLRSNGNYGLLSWDRGWGDEFCHDMPEGHLAVGYWPVLNRINNDWYAEIDEQRVNEWNEWALALGGYMHPNSFQRWGAPVWIIPADLWNLTQNFYITNQGNINWDYFQYGDRVVFLIQGEEQLEGNLLENVEFRVRQVEYASEIGEINLFTNDGWRAANELANTPDEFSALHNVLRNLNNPDWRFGESITAFTDVNGVVRFDLPIGLYLVEEISTPAGVVASAPFLVTIPQTSFTGSYWNYDIRVYPKNDTVGISKDVFDWNDFADEDYVEWRITADIPRNQTRGQWQVAELLSISFNNADYNWINEITNFYRIEDVLPPQLEFSGFEIYLKYMHYHTYCDRYGCYGYYSTALNYFYDEVNFEATRLDNGETLLVWDFDRTAREALAAAPNDAQVVIYVYTYVVDESFDANGAIINEVRLFPDRNSVLWNWAADPDIVEIPGDTIPPLDRPVDWTTPPLTDDAVTYYGGLAIFKHDLFMNPLSGAIFKITVETEDYWGPQPAISTFNYDDYWRKTRELSPTDSEGYTYFTGIRLNQFDEETGLWFRDVLITEIQAPQGYELLAEPISFRVTGPAHLSIPVEILNVPTNAGWQLPFTGGDNASFANIAFIVAIAGVGFLIVSKVVANKKAKTAEVLSQ